MTVARNLFVPADSAGSYHCVSRCVRRAWLCGIDHYSGVDYTHRKPWVEDRLAILCEIFAIGLYGYAIMSNHLHLVCRVDPDAVRAWSDAEVAQRWCRLFPRQAAADNELRCQRLCQQPERLTVLRHGRTPGKTF